jgi:hypothetical protein
MDAQLLKRAGKRALLSERVDRVTGGGAAAGVALTVELKLMIVVSLLFFPFGSVSGGRSLPSVLDVLL